VPFIESSAAISPVTYTQQLVATPLIIVSFLVSLAWVDFRYTARRWQARPHRNARLPAWLHPLARWGTPYEDAGQPRDAAAEPHLQGQDGRWYYRTKQRKLLKMGVADALEIRTTVLAVLGLAFALLAWALWRTGSWAVGLALGRAA